MQKYYKEVVSITLKKFLRKEFKSAILEMWQNNAICYTEYPVVVNNEHYIVDVAVFVYKKYPIKHLTYAIYDNKIGILDKYILDKDNIKKTIAYVFEPADTKTISALAKVFDEVKIFSYEDLVSFYKEKIKMLEELAKEKINYIFSFDCWLSKIKKEKKKSEKLLQIRTSEEIIELFKEIKKITNKTSSELLQWLMWKSLLCLVYEHVEEKT